MFLFTVILMSVFIENFFASKLFLIYAKGQLKLQCLCKTTRLATKLKRFLGKRPALLKSGQWHFHQDNVPVHNSIVVTDYLTKMGIKTIPQPPYSQDVYLKHL